MRFLLRQGGQRSIRTRVLAIVLIPCLALVAVGVTAAAVLVKRGIDARNWAHNVATANGPSVRFFSLIQEERRLSLLRLAGDTVDSAALEQIRPQVDAALVGLTQASSHVNLPGATDSFNQIFSNLPATRTAVDARTITSEGAYTFYDTLIQVLGIGLYQVMLTAKDAVTATELAASVDAFDVVDAMTRAHAEGAASVAGGGFTPENLQFYAANVTYYHIEIQVITLRLAPHGQAQVKKLTDSVQWKRLAAQEQALIMRGPKSPRVPTDTRPVPVTFAQWQKDAQFVADQLQAVWVDQFQLAEKGAAQRGQDTFVRSLLAGLGILLVAGIALGIAIRLSNSLVRRLKRLRADTLELADERLPLVVESLRTGKAIDLTTDVPELEYGRDEVGQVADAFNKAQRTAVAAAQQEAQAREGMSAVFLNIAHRSQMVAHRQLEVLDEAERKQEDPKHLELLFRIDHLATRARRNAENLVILGGERPGRKWRNPVPLDEIARGAVSETESFARVNTVRIPEVLIEGGIVADLIHLIAELVDNATSFSPPGTRVEVRGNLVGRGVVVEIEDQGLGMTESQRERLNAMLQDPPDFQVMALSRQMRLGLFVVAQLANRHGIRVTLAESAYGGTRAIVLIPSAPANVQPIGAGPSGQGELPALASHQHQLYAPSRPGRPTALTAGNGHLPGAPVEWAREHGYGEDGFLLPAENGAGGNGSNGTHRGVIPFVPPGDPAERAPFEPAQYEPAQYETLSSEPAGAELPGAEPVSAGPTTGETPVVAPTAEAPPQPAAPGPVPAAGPVPSGPVEWAPVRPEPVPPQIVMPQRLVPPGPSFQPFPPPSTASGTGIRGNGSQNFGNVAPAAPSSGTIGHPHTSHRHSAGGRAPLPRRRRQEHLAPQLAADLGPVESTNTQDLRTPEQARDTLAAVLRGTREGRQNPPADQSEE